MTPVAHYLQKKRSTRVVAHGASLTFQAVPPAIPGRRT